jgi:hypothetical protein
MRNRFFTAAFAGLVTIAVAAVAAQTPPAAKQAPAKAAPPPTSSSCGPNPPATLKNVAKDSRCFELRTYVVDPAGPGNPDLLQARFREHTDRLFKKHGFSVIGYWQPIAKPDTLIYLLAFKDAATRDADWAAFQADPDWVKVRTDMNVKVTVTNEFMIATDYSPMK